MKVTSKLKIVALIMSIVGVMLIILGIAFPHEECLNCGSGWEGHQAAFGDHIVETPNFLLLVPGIFITFFSLPVWAIALRPALTKVGAQIQSETMDYAGEDVKEAIDKTVDVAAPGAKKIVKTVVGSVKEAINGDVKEELLKAQQLYDDGLITEEEYQQLRKKILDL